MSGHAKFGTMEIAIPAGWRDASTVMLVAPEPEIETERALQPIAAGVAPNIVIRREPRREQSMELLEEVAALQERELNRLPGTRVEGRGTEDLGDGQLAVSRVFSLPSPDGLAVRQLQLYFFRGESVVLFVGTAPATSLFEQLRPTFLEVARSIR